MRQGEGPILRSLVTAVAAGAVIGAAASGMFQGEADRDDASSTNPATYRLTARNMDPPVHGGTVPSLPQMIVGRASVIDADTIKIRGQSIRLFGIDALEDGQKCLAGGERQRCAQRAALALADKIGRRNVACEKRDRDRYGRIVGVCHAGGENLNAWLVAEGWALAYRRYSRLYVGEEDAARRARKGIWRTRFVKPWEARRGRRLGEQIASRRCAIKGNIASDGERIYHVPGGYYYHRTRISESEGERWFCSEEAARAAGWRRALR